MFYQVPLIPQHILNRYFSLIPTMLCCWTLTAIDCATPYPWHFPSLGVARADNFVQCSHAAPLTVRARIVLLAIQHKSVWMHPNLDYFFTVKISTRYVQRYSNDKAPNSAVVLACSNQFELDVVLACYNYFLHYCNMPQPLIHHVFCRCDGYDGILDASTWIEFVLYFRVYYYCCLLDRRGRINRCVNLLLMYVYKYRYINVKYPKRGT